MSIVTLQVGQCGNQIGHEFFTLLMKDAKTDKSRNVNHISAAKSHSLPSGKDLYCRDVVRKFFTEKKDASGYTAKAILIDTEPKVINRIVKQAKHQGQFSYSQGNVYMQSRGSGNNWAYGYNCHGEDAVEKTMNLCRKELEECDRFGGFLILMSLAGGTGSGLGTHLTLDLKDHFPRKFILNQVVLPYSSGEVILQNYNAVLTLSHLYENSDAISIFENDNLSQICHRSLGLKTASMDGMNNVAAHKLASVLQPSLDHGQSLHSAAFWQSTIGDLIESTCSIPRYKLLAIRNTPHLNQESMAYSSYIWPALLKHLRQMVITNSPLDEGIDWELQPPPLVPNAKLQTKPLSLLKKFNKSVANHLILRGNDLHQADIESFMSPELYPAWSAGVPCNVWSQARNFLGYEKSATVVTNSQAHVRSLDRVVQKAWNMFASRAYIHQYLKCGLSEEDFINAFVASEQIISDYASL